LRDIIAVSLTTFAIRESLRRGEIVEVDTDEFISMALSEPEVRSQMSDV
jgi:hypothetical protein